MSGDNFNGLRAGNEKYNSKNGRRLGPVVFILDFEVIREHFLKELKNDTITPLRVNYLLI
jgi:hypothetical protein